MNWGLPQKLSENHTFKTGSASSSKTQLTDSPYFPAPAPLPAAPSWQSRLPSPRRRSGASKGFSPLLPSWFSSRTPPRLAASGRRWSEKRVAFCLGRRYAEAVCYVVLFNSLRPAALVEDTGQQVSSRFS